MEFYECSGHLTMFNEDDVDMEDPSHQEILQNMIHRDEIIMSNHHRALDKLAVEFNEAMETFLARISEPQLLCNEGELSPKRRKTIGKKTFIRTIPPV